MIQFALFFFGLVTVFFGIIESASTESSLQSLSDSLGVALISTQTNGAVLWVGGWLMIGLSGVIGIIWRAVKILDKMALKMSELNALNDQLKGIEMKFDNGASATTTTATNAKKSLQEGEERLAAIQAKYDLR